MDSFRLLAVLFLCELSAGLGTSLIRIDAGGKTAQSVHRHREGPENEVNSMANATLCAELWDGKSVFGSDGANACDLVSLANHWTWGGGQPPKMCLRPKKTDLLSDTVRQNQRFPDCAALAYLWKKLPNGAVSTQSGRPNFAPCGAKGSNKLFVDVGANIGACTLAMLSRPDVSQVVAFEPNPKNLFYLTGSVLKNDKNFSERLTMFPMALGSKHGEHSMYMPDSNVGGEREAMLTLKTADQQPVTSRTRTLDEVLAFRRPMPYVHLLRLNAPGFEVNVLKGAQKLLASGVVNTIQFRLAPKLLKGQATSAAELISLLELAGYYCHNDLPEPFPTTMEVELEKPISSDDLVDIACSEDDVNLIAVYSPVKAASGGGRAIKCPAPAA